MPSVSSSRQSPAPALAVPCPSNPVLVATQSQWLFSDAELRRTPSVLDGMAIEAEHTSRSKGVNFITQVGILLKLPQLTLCTASVYLHRFFMRYSMVDLPQRPGMHPYSIAATALFLATKVEENCRKMRELIIACCRVALKQPGLVVDEQSKEFWKWRDTILHNEDLLLEALCFDLQLEQPYRLLYDFLCYFHVQDNKRLRNSAWAFVNDSTFTVLCIQFSARTIAASALYAAARYCDVTFEDDQLGRPWWEQIEVDLKEIRRACNRIAEIYENHSLPKPGQKYPTTPVDEAEATDKTRRVDAGRAGNSISNGDESRGVGSTAGSTDASTNGRQYDGEDGSQHHHDHQHTSDSRQHTPGTTSNGAAALTSQETTERSPKRQRLSDGLGKSTEPSSTSSPSSQHQSQKANHISSQETITNATSAINISSTSAEDETQQQQENPDTNTTNTKHSTPDAPDHKPKSPPSPGKPNSRIPAQGNTSSRVPASYQQQQQQRMEHPLPPPPPVSIPPLPHDRHESRRE